jgi:hypothetical protein
MIDTYQLTGNGQIALGFRPLPAAGPAGAVVMVQTLLYASVGATLGILVGITLAAAPWRASTPTPQLDFAQVNSTAAPANSNPVASAGQVASVQVQAVSQWSVQPAFAQVAPAVKTTAVVSKSSTHKHRGARLLSATWTRSSVHTALFHHPRTFSHSPAVAPTVAAQAATPINTPAPVILTIEGDLTLVNFDATAGTIETQEGKTFLNGTTVSETAAQHWQEAQGNVHFRCDLNGSCTLFHAGVVVHNARMTI